MKQLKIFLVWGLAILANVVSAQDPYHYSIGRNQGLMVESIYHIYEDSKGFIWLATSDGLLRYDGYDFKVYQAKGQSSKSGNHIIEDKSGSIWYETFDGFLYHTSGDSLIGINQTRPLGWREFEIIGDHMFLFSDREILVYAISQAKWIQKIPLPFSYILGMWKSGNTLYCLGDALVTVDENLRVTQVDVEVDPQKFIPVISSDQGGKFHFISKIAALKQLMEFDGEKIKKAADLREVSFVQNLYQFEDKYWVCAPEGLYIYSENEGLMNGAPFFKGKNIACAHRDKWGRYWLGTINEGLMVVEDLDTRFFKSSPEQIARVNNELVIGAKAGNLYSLGENGQLTLRHKSSSSHGISLLKYDTVYHQIYYVDQGINVLDDHFNKIIDFRIAVKDLVRLDEKYMAIASSSGIGFFRIGADNLKSEWDDVFEKIKWEIYPDWRWFQTCRGKSIAYDKEMETLLCSSNLGTYIFSKEGLKEVQFQNKILFLQKVFFFKDNYYGLSSDGMIWKSDRSLKQMILIAPSEMEGPLKRMRVQDHFLFINDNKHLRYYDLNNWEAGSKPIKNWAGQEALNDLVLWDKKMFAALDHGLLCLEFVKENSVPKTPFYVLSAKVNGVITPFTAIGSLNYKQNNIEINYAVLSYLPSTAEPVYYAINDGAWQVTSAGLRALRLESLAPGKYTIRFKVGDNIESQTINFEIEKPFWLKWWFIFSCSVLVLALIYFYYQYRTKNLRRQNRLLNEKIILEKNLHKATMKSIKSQMNPHFFYNALNTIQSFIFTDDKRRASTFLAKFSKLTRIILEMSDKERVTVKEELLALELYLEIEQVRFDDDFAFEIAVDPNIDLDLVKLPSMIVQPYVENAVKHGLLHKKGEKYLKVSFLSESGLLVVVIDDNGIGRKKSEELNAIKNRGHKAFATEANHKRLEILNQTNERMGVEYIDKHDELQQPSGTKVIIRIPI